MKKILITGLGSYIGTSFENWINNYEGYRVDTLDMIGDEWKNFDFSPYDCVFHVAGLAHSNPKSEMKDLYYKVNTDLTVDTAIYAKQSGVKQFIFMSSIIIYGKNNTYITENTIPRPDNFYGDSKLKADLRLKQLQDENFDVVIIRPPMIYGKGSKGNYPKLAKLARAMPVFPSLQNKRSMLHIENLCNFIKLMIDNEESGIFYPQNKEYVSTAELVCQVAKAYNRRVRLIGIANFILKPLSKHVTVFNKLFGDLVYDKKMSDYDNFSYCVNDFESSIKRTEKYEK